MSNERARQQMESITSVSERISQAISANDAAVRWHRDGQEYALTWFDVIKVYDADNNVVFAGEVIDFVEANGER